MNRIRALCGRDVVISINGRKLLQAESAELRNISEMHRIRSCFCSDDVAYVAGKRESCEQNCPKTPKIFLV